MRAIEVAAYASSRPSNWTSALSGERAASLWIIVNLDLMQGMTILGKDLNIMYYTYYIVFCINTVRIIGRHNTADRSRSRAAASCRAACEAENPMLNLVTTPSTVTATMAAAAETRRLDIEAMHAKALSIFNTIKAARSRRCLGS